jgi:hypothetical protein
MQSTLGVSRDGQFVVVRDNSIQVRHFVINDPEDEDNIKRYASNDYIRYLEER